MKTIYALVVGVAVGAVVLGAMLPIFSNATSGTEITIADNGEGAGVELGYIDDIPGAVGYSTTAAINGDKLVLTGSYTATVDAVNQIICMTDNVVIFVEGGALYKMTNGARITYNSITINVVEILGNYSVAGYNATWAYVPTDDGAYRSYNEPVERIIGTCAGYGSFGDLIRAWNDGDAVYSDYNLEATPSVNGVVYKGATE